MKTTYILISVLALLLLAGCSQTAAPEGVDVVADVEETAAEVEEEMAEEEAAEEVVFKIGAIQPLTGDAAVIGESILAATEAAVADVNEMWAEKNMRIELFTEDGKCAGKEGLSAAQNLVNNRNVDVIYGGVCSGETLGFASFTEGEEVLVVSPTSSSPEITTAGDYVFRVYPSDTAQVAKMTTFLQDQGYASVGILAENTDYAQALREGYIASLEEAGIEVVADESVLSETKDVRTELVKITAAEPEALILIPQSTATGGVFAKQTFESGFEGDVIGNDVIGLDEVLSDYSAELEGMHFPHSFFAKEDDPGFATLVEESGCAYGYYCASTYDGIFLLAEIFESCGADSACMRDALYATENWEGKFASPLTFDENGDVAGEFVVKQVQDGEGVTVA